MPTTISQGVVFLEKLTPILILSPSKDELQMVLT
jgi:hypothetical protein